MTKVIINKYLKKHYLKAIIFTTFKGTNQIIINAFINRKKWQNNFFQKYYFSNALYDNLKKHTKIKIKNKGEGMNKLQQFYVEKGKEK